MSDRIEEEASRGTALILDAMREAVREIDGLKRRIVRLERFMGETMNGDGPTPKKKTTPATS